MRICLRESRLRRSDRPYALGPVASCGGSGDGDGGGGVGGGAADGGSQRWPSPIAVIWVHKAKYDRHVGPRQYRGWAAGGGGTAGPLPCVGPLPMQDAGEDVHGRRQRRGWASGGGRTAGALPCSGALARQDASEDVHDRGLQGRHAPRARLENGSFLGAGRELGDCWGRGVRRDCARA